MCISAIVAGVGLALSAVSAVQGFESLDNQKKALAESQKQSELQRRSMDLDAKRKRRSIIRQANIARAESASTASNQGTSESSTSLGAIQTIGSVATSNQQTVGQDLELGHLMADSKSREASYLGKANEANTLGNAIGSLGGGLIKNAGTISRIGGDLFSFNQWEDYSFQ